MIKRLRQPYLGKVGALTGKVRFGETFRQAAERELYEETGLKANSFCLQEIYHKLRKRPDGSWVQDVIFYIFVAKKFTGKLIEKTTLQENFWGTKDKIFNSGRYDPYDDLNLDFTPNSKKLIFTESIALAEGF